jgi:glycosyltransferase involved in cell wall biosynthesis
MISVVLCTFNGERYLVDQFESILNQSLLPNEIIVSDDGSSDLTKEIVLSYKKKFEDAEVFFDFIENKRTKGVTANFENALSLARGDIIFFADQDDVWQKNKVEIIQNEFQKNPEALLIHSDANLINAKELRLNKSLFQTIRLTVDLQSQLNDSSILFGTLMQRNIVTGATMAIRSSLLPLSFPFSEDWLHDEWLALCASSQNQGFVCLPNKLINYRLHQNNVVGLKKRTVRGFFAFFFASRAGRYDQLFNRFTQLSKHGISKTFEYNVQLQIQQRLSFEIDRLTYPVSRLKRVASIFNNSTNGNYQTFFEKPKTEMLRDLLQSA